MEFPNWEHMPNSQPLVTLSWEDIYGKAQEITQEEFSRNPIQKEIKELFDHILQKGMDMENGTFWSTVEYRCEEYYKEMTN